MNNNIQEIQELYKNVEQKKESREGRVENEEVILIKPYKESITISKSSKSSFIHDKIKNLEKYIKFIHSPTQMRLFKPPPYYQSLQSRGEQDLKF